VHKYIIISLKHSEKNSLCFWRPKDAGYTIFPFMAGIYTEEEVKAKPHYYNNGYNSLAIPLTEIELESIGFKVSYDLKKLLELAEKAEKEIQP
jgi:hypothetical protein